MKVNVKLYNVVEEQQPLDVQQIATTSVLKSSVLAGGVVTSETKITNLYAGVYDSSANLVKTNRQDLKASLKLSDLGITSGSFTIGSATITIDAETDTIGSVMQKINDAGYSASIETVGLDTNKEAYGRLVISGPSGQSIAITSQTSNFTSQVGLTVSEGNFFINGAEFQITENTTVGSLMQAINSASADNVGAKLENGKLVLVASETGAIDINVTKGTSNFTNAAGFTVGGVMNSANLTIGSDGSYVTLTGTYDGLSLSDSVGGSIRPGNFKVYYNQVDEHGNVSSE